MAGKLNVRLENRLDEIQRVDTAIEEFSDQVSLPFEVSFQVRLSIEELFTNILNYGYEDNDHAVHEILVSVEVRDNELEVCLVDDAREFNPLSIDPNTNKPDLLEDMELGGKGWALVRAYMDEFDYQYQDGKNHLTLRKKLDPQG